MQFESEVYPLFLFGTTFVNLLELVVGCRLLRKIKGARIPFVGHVLCMEVAFVFLIRVLFGGRLGLYAGIPSIDNSIGVALFGVCWMFSVILILDTINICCKNNNHSEE